MAIAFCKAQKEILELLPTYDVIECECKYIADLYRPTLFFQGFRCSFAIPSTKRVIVLRWKHWRKGELKHTLREEHFMSTERVEKG